MERKPIRVLVVEDSAVQREFLVGLLRSDPALEIAGTVTTGEDAVDFVQQDSVDVVTMDINLPQMDGFEATRQIMETRPTPVVIVTSTTNPREVATTFRAMEAGALAVLPIPAGIGHPEHPATTRELIQTVKTMSEVRVVKRWSRSRGRQMGVSTPELRVRKRSPVEIVAIGASTGGPLVLQTILAGLPATFPVPIVIVQHIAAGFVHGLVEWLKHTSGVPVHVAVHGEQMLPGHAYVAPDNAQMFVRSNRTIMLRDDPPESGLRPAVSYLFRSINLEFDGGTVAVLLTGMGRDGADELKQIKDAGGTTIAQSAESCVVNGMPGEAVKINGASHILPPNQIAATLKALVMT